MYIRNPFTILAKNLGELNDYIYVDIELGETGIVRKGDEKTAPILRIGGKGDVLQSSADKEIDSTIVKRTGKEGLMTNPYVLFPSSFFSPIPPMIKGLFTGPLSVMENPDLVIGIIAIYASSRGNEKSYNKYHYDTKFTVIDNKDLEDRLFGNI